MFFRLLLALSLLFNGWPMAMPTLHAAPHADGAGVSPPLIRPCHAQADQSRPADAVMAEATQADTGGPVSDGCCSVGGCACPCMHSSAVPPAAMRALPPQRPAMTCATMGRTSGSWREMPAIRPPIA
ncbi:CopL family metal-binding regulatory protein [Rehaibacterium terrae]|uniref:CopL family metal-binding regulatory protein n=1 Tax=Rehaibacterium terrae TaxID=1341696 RepID=A0A7W7XYW7_9GAMM|nr:CopL family metal-binding regulatory protein [Rehaibacterium terrae]MBB5014977.1 hypothetical protein [Rehaibacterium terrae]